MKPSNRMWQWLMPLLLLLTLAGCGVFGPDRPDHSFGFDVADDSPDVRVLDYRYGNSKLPVAPDPRHLREGRVAQATGVFGPMLRGEFLYVKWQIKSTGQIYADTVDLRERLPANITDHKVYFTIKGPQLYVWLIAPEKKPADWPIQMPDNAYSYRKTYQLYPDRAAPAADSKKD